MKFQDTENKPQGHDFAREPISNLIGKRPLSDILSCHLRYLIPKQSHIHSYRHH